MKLTDPQTKREAIIDGTIKDANGGAVGPTTSRALYVDKEGVQWTIDREPHLTSQDEWQGYLTASTQSNVYTKDPRGLDLIGIIWKRSLLDVVEAIDAYGFAWRSAGRKQGGDFPWWLVVVIALLAKGKRR